MRIAFVIDRYWPLMTATSRVVEAVVRQLRQQGHDAFVMTAQVDRLWPESLLVRDIPVLRFGIDYWNLFSRRSLGQRISTWLLENREQWDMLVICDTVEGGESLFQVADRLERPCSLCFFESGPNSRGEQLLAGPYGSQGKSQADFPRIESWRQHRHWIVGDEEMAKKIVRFHAAAQVDIWSIGLPELEPPTSSQRAAVRAAVFNAVGGTRLTSPYPLVVYFGHALDGHDLRWLWFLLSRLAESRAELNIWVVGDGPGRPAMIRRAYESGLEDRVLFPGYFSDTYDLCAAADLLLYPQTQRWLTYDWLCGIALETPTLAVENSATREWAKRTEQALKRTKLWENLLPQELDLWSHKITDMLQHQGKARLLAKMQRAAILECESQTASVLRFEQLLLTRMTRH